MRAVVMRSGAAALALACFLAAPGAWAQPAPPDPQTKALLFGAAFAKSDLSTDEPGGMMFLPGRGLIRWETRGLSLAEQEELKTEAVGLADARAVQAEIDAREEARQAERRRADETMWEREHDGLVADSRWTEAQVLTPTGGPARAGAVVPLNKAAEAQIVGALGLHEGATFKDRGRFYLFAAISGRAVGLNLLPDNGFNWRNAGLSTDKGGFIGQRQIGLAWRNNFSQTSLSYVREKTRAQLLGITAIKDHRAMIDFTLY